MFANLLWSLCGSWHSSLVLQSGDSRAALSVESWGGQLVAMLVVMLVVTMATM